MAKRDTGYLAIDQGTTSTRAILFDSEGAIVCSAGQDIKQHFPAPGWVEHDPEDIWDSVKSTVGKVVQRAACSGVNARAIGITNQRETTLIWNRRTGKPIYNAIVWQDRRTAARCAQLHTQGLSEKIVAASGLVIDPYFSASKIAWILDNVPGAREQARDGELAFGTVDTFLLSRLTGGAVHATDATNASRTSLYNIVSDQWDKDLLDIFDVPEQLLPEVRDSTGYFGTTTKESIGACLPVMSILGDQQAAAIGQGCVMDGMTKATFGTGCFVLSNLGSRPVFSSNRLLTTIAYRTSGQIYYALEGSIFIAGAIVQWLRDGVALVSSANDTETMSAELTDNDGVYFVPAFTGLGAPHWKAEARGLITGLTRGTSREHIVRAAIESVVYQTNDLLSAMTKDGACPTTMRVDGGMVGNDWMMQFLADITGVEVERPASREATASGIAVMTALADGMYSDLGEASNNWKPERRFLPNMDCNARDSLIQGWNKAVAQTLVGL